MSHNASHTALCDEMIKIGMEVWSLTVTKKPIIGAIRATLDARRTDTPLEGEEEDLDP